MFTFPNIIRLWMLEEKVHKYKVFVLHTLFIAVTIIASRGISFDTQVWAVNIARYVFYLFFIRGTQEAMLLAYKVINLKQKVNLLNIVQANKTNIYTGGGTAAILIYTKETIFMDDFLFLFAAHVVVKYLEMEHSPSTIRYGIGMACSYFEGYLALILPSDGVKLSGFQAQIAIYEDNEGIVFPVKKLFIVITKSMYCPPDLMEFNKPNSMEKGLTWMESCECVAKVEKDVAGVKRRVYRSSAYKLHLAGGEPVFVAAECATPLHTLHRVLQKQALYEELRNIDVEEVVTDFIYMVQSIVNKNPECQGKCILVYYDDKDPTQNLGDVLLDKIRELEPNFESIKRQ